jgi:hypothetical protein
MANGQATDSGKVGSQGWHGSSSGQSGQARGGDASTARRTGQLKLSQAPEWMGHSGFVRVVRSAASKTSNHFLTIVTLLRQHHHSLTDCHPSRARQVGKQTMQLSVCLPCRLFAGPCLSPVSISHLASLIPMRCVLATILMSRAQTLARTLTISDGALVVCVWGEVTVTR